MALDDASIILGLSDPEPRIREQTIRLAEPRLKHAPAVLQQLIALAADPEPMVRFQLAFSLGEANLEPSAIAALATIAIQGINSSWTRTAVLSSIAGRALALFEALAKREEFLTNSDGQAWLTSWRTWLAQNSSLPASTNCCNHCETPVLAPRR